MLGLLTWLAAIATALFAGGALYVSLAEHPARLACGPPMAVAQFRTSYPRAYRLQGSLAAVGTLCGVGAWLARLDVDLDNGGLAADPRFFPHGEEFRGLRVHQTRLAGGDASSDSYCYP